MVCSQGFSRLSPCSLSSISPSNSDHSFIFNSQNSCDSFGLLYCASYCSLYAFQFYQQTHYSHSSMPFTDVPHRFNFFYPHSIHICEIILLRIFLTIIKIKYRKTASIVLRSGYTPSHRKHHNFFNNQPFSSYNRIFFLCIPIFFFKLSKHRIIIILN